jgi:hypothetical protein
LKNPVYLSSVDCFNVGCSAGISSLTPTGALLYPIFKLLWSLKVGINGYDMEVCSVWY